MLFKDVDELTLLNDAIEAGGMAWWIMELPSGVVFFHPNKTKMLGYTGKDTEKFTHYSSFTDLLHPDDYEHTMQDMRDHLDGRKDLYETSYRIKCKDGTYRRYFDRGKIVARYDDSTAVAGIVIEIPDAYLSEGIKKPAKKRNLKSVI